MSKLKSFFSTYKRSINFTIFLLSIYFCYFSFSSMSANIHHAEPDSMFPIHMITFFVFFILAFCHLAAFFKKISPLLIFSMFYKNVDDVDNYEAII
jgi:hypothetical protein